MQSKQQKLIELIKGLIKKELREMSSAASAGGEY